MLQQPLVMHNHFSSQTQIAVNKQSLSMVAHFAFCLKAST